MDNNNDAMHCVCLAPIIWFFYNAIIARETQLRKSRKHVSGKGMNVILYEILDKNNTHQRLSGLMNEEVPQKTGSTFFFTIF